MTNWLHGLSVPWLAVVTFVAMFVATAVIYAIVIPLASGERAKVFKSVSPGLLPPLGLVFGLMVGFLAAQVWDQSDRAQLAVNNEASSLRAVRLLSAEFPGTPEARIRSLIRRQIEQAVTEEWPAMARQDATVSLTPPLGQALPIALHIDPAGPGEVVAQRELVTSLEGALDARRDRIIVSESSVNWAKWIGVLALAVITLIAIACVHCDSRLGAAIAMALFAAAAAVCVVIIAVQDRPFAGPFRVSPAVLEQVAPKQL